MDGKRCIIRKRRAWYGTPPATRRVYAPRNPAPQGAPVPYGAEKGEQDDLY